MSNNLCVVGKGRAYAKVNLHLSVGKRREDSGLHELQMVVVPYKKYADDALFCMADGELVVAGIRFDTEGIDSGRYLKSINAKLPLIAQHFGVGGRLYLNKGIPLGKGLGSSVAMLVAIVKAIENCLDERGESVQTDSKFLLSLGSDAACMHYGEACIVKGVGDDIVPIEDEGGYEMSDVLFDEGVDAATAYKMFDQKYPNGKKDAVRCPQSVGEAILTLHNDLQEFALLLVPQLKERVDLMLAQNKTNFIVSGSGSALILIEKTCK